ncbi:Uncharacterised protein [Vibrio cholerae]|nr:Uncharacterised protein [Vibrio cholerae]CRZ60062.1 Uncharacterised protein [Vibrio cholerae]CRZ63016.1 Uncharacterised protein [Vibrio cholerae]CRZ66091.1 Uncharacterised protein [Vibrio cholerae]CRZ69937.1 Uncharacterised protein [Vibrio cholerae]
MCAVMRRTWRLRPSIKVMANHVVGIAARKRTGGLRGQSVGSGMMSTFAGKVGPSFKVTPWRNASRSLSCGEPSTCTQ